MPPGRKDCTMSKTIDKLTDEITKTKTKISELQSRVRDLEQQKTEAENVEIIMLVRGMEVAPENLRTVIEAYKEKNLAGKEKSENEE